MIGRRAINSLAVFLIVAAALGAAAADAADSAKMTPGTGTLKLTLGPKDDPIPLTLARDAARLDGRDACAAGGVVGAIPESPDPPDSQAA